MPDLPPPRLLVLGAHPDDAEYHAGGLIAWHRERDGVVKIVSVTDGRAGHFDTSRSDTELVATRRREAAAAGAVVGAEYVCWDFPDAALEPTLAVRRAIVREMRTFRPDLVLTHRPTDYHPDHRAVGQAVQDASYLVTVPRVEPDVPPLRRDPVVASMVDLFTKPVPLRPQIVHDVEPWLDAILGMLAAHASQVFEWLAYEEGVLDDVPADPEQRLVWLRGWFERRTTERADRFRDELVATYGERRGTAVRFCEAYEFSEYAAWPDDATLQRLFPVPPVPTGPRGSR